MNKKLLILFVIILLIFSCKSKVETPKDNEYPIEEKIINGTKTLINPDYPRELEEYEFIEELSIGHETKDEQSIVNRPMDVRSDNLGNIYILDWGDVNIKKYDQNGEFIKSIGHEGQGPGDFSIPLYFDISPTEEICVLDMSQRRISIFNLSGDYKEDFSIEGSCTKIQVKDSNNILFDRIHHGQSVDVIGEYTEIDIIKGIYRVDFKGNNEFHFGDFKGETQRVMRTKTGMVGGKGPYEVKWSASKKGEIAVGYNENYLLSYYSPEGHLKFKFGKEYIPIPNPRYRGQSFVKQFKHVYSKLIFDDDANLWIQIAPNEEIEGVTYDIFSAEGIYIRQTMAPYPIYHLSNNKAYCIARTDEEYNVIKRFKIKKPLVEKSH